MNNTDIPRIRAWFEAYSGSFLTGDEMNDKNIRLKIDHSYRVLERMSDIADRLKLGGKKRSIALTCALLHDCGRFEQFEKYRTYADVRSENHGRLGVKVLEENDVLTDLTSKTAEIITKAVLLHNAKALPDNLTAEQRYFTELTRDADKIDIFNVVVEYYLDDDPLKDRTVVHNLPEGEDVCDEVFEEFMHEGHVTFDFMKSVVDFKVFQIGWVWDINNRAALRILSELGYVERIISLMPVTVRTTAVAERYRTFIQILDDEKRLSWTEISREKLHDCRIFSLYSSQRESSVGTTSTAYMIEAPDWVTIVPLIEKGGEDYFVMVRQYRHGSMDVTTEFPAGTLEPGEEPETAALRELQEETGYKAGRMTWLGSVNPNPAFLTNNFTAYLAEELTSTGTQNLDEHEYVDYDLIPVSEVVRRMGSGEYSNGTMLMALMYYLRESGKIKLD
ncbi:MAG: NUDIX domain-containing protein [Spirochaetales bacterium]|nr:NUDIX domain-containing protein [Spirochaetales bacterium]